jgi:glycosyl transferase, family 25
LSIAADTIQLLQTYFDKIFVITLPRLTQRHHDIRKSLQNLPYDFFYGVDKIQLTPDFIKTSYNDAEATKRQRQGKGLNIGEIACALSHRLLYEEIVKNKWQKVLVLEDDVLPLQENLALLPAALNELPAEWELFYLGYLRHEMVTPALKRKQVFYKILSRLGLMKWTPTMVSHLLPLPYSKHLRKAGFHDCTHAYALTLEAAEKLIRYQTPVIYRADDLLSSTIMKGELKAFVTTPKFFDQQSIHQKTIPSQIRE